MRRHRFAACVAILFACTALSAQSGRQPVEIHLGDAAVPLNGPWAFSVGDSPIDPKTGGPQWAVSGFDDSHWESVDLTPRVLADPGKSPTKEGVPGWTALGHGGYSGYAWYRIRVRLAASQVRSLRLALSGPRFCDDAYQVFIDGALAGSFGSFTRARPTTHVEQPMFFSLRSTQTVAPDGAMTVAFRFWMSPATLSQQMDSGGMHSAPVLGRFAAVEAGYELQRGEIYRANATSYLRAILFFIVAVVAFSILAIDPSEPVYAWMGVGFFLCFLDFGVLSFLSLLTTALSVTAVEILYSLLGILIAFTVLMSWWTWFRLNREQAWRWKPLRFIPRLGALLIPLYFLSACAKNGALDPWIPLSAAPYFSLPPLVCTLLMFFLILLSVVMGIWRQRGREWPVIPVVILFLLGTFEGQLQSSGIPVYYPFFGITIPLDCITTTLITFTILVLLFLRLGRSMQRKREMEADLKSAQAVQRVLLPGDVSRHGDFTIETDYRPAKEVGGDFYQVIPAARDGSLLIVAGDVAGKGLQAGMLVSLLVGAIHTAAEDNPDPLFVLAALNRRLLGRSAYTTCLALRIDSNGQATLANAGHLPPYLNGTPVAIDGSMPLGFLDGAEFSVAHFPLAPEDRLVMVSDGLAEAMNSEGQLFGFERVQSLVKSRTPAGEIAAQVQRFGQEDDISIIAVTRQPALLHA
jgi:hypothetical protein